MSKQRERILITVRTYPTPSASHIETVCTGGINDNGEWRRLYPLPLRYLEESRQFRTYDIIEIDLTAGKDKRPETRRPDSRSLKIIGACTTWSSRHQWVGPTIAPSLRLLKESGRSLAPVKVNRILDMNIKAGKKEWSSEQLRKLEQAMLFESNKPLEKIPYEFRFTWQDDEEDTHDSIIIDWEICQTWRKWRHLYPDDVLERIRDQWLNHVCDGENEIAFFMGNQRRFQDTFMICGIYHPPKKEIENGTLW